MQEYITKEMVYLNYYKGDKFLKLYEIDIALNKVKEKDKSTINFKKFIK